MCEITRYLNIIKLTCREDVKGGNDGTTTTVSWHIFLFKFFDSINKLRWCIILLKSSYDFVIKLLAIKSEKQ